MVEGSVDRAFLRGLKERYCRTAQLVEGIYRGRSGATIRRELTIELPLLFKKEDCVFVVVLTDSNDQDWMTIFNREFNKVPVDLRYKTIYGVAQRNIECWLCLDRDALARRLNCEPQELDVPDPSRVVKRRFGFVRDPFENEQAEHLVSDFVSDSAYHTLTNRSSSFKHFWNQVREKAALANCQLSGSLD